MPKLSYTSGSGWYLHGCNTRKWKLAKHLKKEQGGVKIYGTTGDSRFSRNPHKRTDAKTDPIDWLLKYKTDIDEFRVVGANERWYLRNYTSTYYRWTLRLNKAIPMTEIDNPVKPSGSTGNIKRRH